MAEQTKVTTLEKVVIRFSGDSGDGMQLTGTIFSNLSAIFGNEISTFPDYPAEVRAPQGTLSGVSGFQVHLGSRKIFTPGDKADVLVAMNPAALKVNVKNIKPNAIVIIDTDSFKKSDLDKALYTTDDPFKELGLNSVQVVAAPISTMVKDGLAEFGLDNKSALRSKNMFALGLVCWLFDRPLEEAMNMLQNKFAKKPVIAQANIKALTDGYNYGHNIHASVSTYRIESKKAEPGFYTDVNGNKATSYGLIAAAEKAGLRAGRPGAVRKGVRGWITALPFILPGLILVAVFVLYPLLFTIRIALSDYQIVQGNITFIGLENFKKVLSGGSRFWYAYRNNFLYALVTVPFILLGGMLFAYLINNLRRGQGVFRVGFYLPVITSWVIVSLVFQYMFNNSNRGLINYILVDVLHVLDDYVPWLLREWSGNAAIWLMGIWKNVGWAMLIYLAALQSIPKEHFFALVSLICIPSKGFSASKLFGIHEKCRDFFIYG